MLTSTRQWFNRLRLRLRSLTRRDRLDGELGDELGFHLDQQIEENIANGMSREEARYAAMRTIGGMAQIQEECRDERRVNHIETIFQDLRYALRGLRKTPGFTAVAVLSLALGIGANTAVFSVVYPVMVRSLPYPEANRVLRVGHRPPQEWSASLVEYEFLKKNAQAFSSIAAYGGLGDQTLTADGNVEWIKALGVSSGFFESLGVAPMMGREFGTDEMRAGGARSIIISNALWRRAFGGDPSAIGKRAMIGGAGFTVVGVLPEGFWFPAVAEVYYPYRASGAVSDEGVNSRLVARLKAGVSAQQADQELTALTEAWKKTYPDKTSPAFAGFGAIGLQRSMTGDVRTTLLLLFGAVGLLLTIACLNLASLLFARMSARQREIAVRLALGSSAGRLVRLFVIENAVVVLTGGAPRADGRLPDTGYVRAPVPVGAAGTEDRTEP